MSRNKNYRMSRKGRHNTGGIIIRGDMHTLRQFQLTLCKTGPVLFNVIHYHLRYRQCI